MADNPYVNKVEYAGQTLIDLTNDTVTPSDVMSGATFHDRSGTPQTGSLITHDVYDGLDSTSSTDALSANQGRVLNEKLGRQIVQIAYTNVANPTFSLANNSRYLFICTESTPSSRGYVALLSATTQGAVDKADIFKGSGVTVDIATNNRLKLTFASTGNRYYYCVSLNGVALMQLV